MARFGRDKLEELRQRADVVELIGAQVRLKRSGRNYLGLCPFHGEKTPSFSVNPERGFFHCFGCGVGGTVFDFVMRSEGVTFPEAVRLLARRYGVTIPESDDEGPGAGERDAMLRAAEVASAFFVHVLWKTDSGAPAREYLKRRAISTESAREFVIGFAPPQPAALAKALERRNLLEIALKIGLVKRGGDGVHDMFRGRLIFPIRDGQGRPIAFGGRVLDDRLPKYINSSDSPLYSKARNVYGLFEARRAIAQNDRAIVVEGYIDAIALWQAGFREVVASLGTAVTVDQLRILGRNTRNVMACFDGDSAGQKASIRALPVFLEAGLERGRGIFLPAELDPDRLIRDRGAEVFRTLIESAQLLVDRFLEEQADQARLVGEARAAERVAEMLRLITNRFEFDHLSRRAADKLKISEELLRNYARSQSGRPARKGQVDSVPPPKRAEPQSRVEVGLLALALSYRELRSELLEAQPFDYFVDSALSVLLFEVCESQASAAELAVLMAERLSEDQKRDLSALVVRGSSKHESKAVEGFHIPHFKEIDEQLWVKRGTEEDARSAAELHEARKMLGDYLKALRPLRREMDGLARDLKEGDEKEATAKAQSMISLRREANRVP